MNVKLICTTEDPLDSLEHHQAIADDGFEIAVHLKTESQKAHDDRPTNEPGQQSVLNGGNAFIFS